ncbi:MAG: TRAP transporter substrate-binding protein DctP [Deltaproteobacteria bacterium]|nr:TRAP transporter substrate-binding protein DctP [Deltaproteobacteria bacterium]
MKKAYVLTVLSVFLISFLALTPDSAFSRQIELRFNYSMPAKVPPTTGWEWFARELTKRSGGRIKVTTFPHGALFKIRQAWENIIAGTADITNLSVRTFAKRLPLTSLTMLPTIYWPDTAEATVASGRAIMTLYREFPEIQEEFRDLKVLCFNQLAAYHLLTKKPVRKPSDLKGMKIGAGGIMGEFIQSQGGSFVAIAPPKSYMSLKTGVVDGMAMAWSAMGVYKLWEVAGYVNEITIGRVPLPVVMNKQAWNSLPPDLQDLVMKLANEQMEYGTKTLYDNLVRQKKNMIKNGVKAYVPTGTVAEAWSNEFRPLEKRWLAERERQGLKVAPKVLKRYKELASKFRQ